MIDLFITMHDVLSCPIRGYPPQCCWDAVSTRTAPLLFPWSSPPRQSLEKRKRWPFDVAGDGKCRSLTGFAVLPKDVVAGGLTGDEATTVEGAAEGTTVGLKAAWSQVGSSGRSSCRHGQAAVGSPTTTWRRCWTVLSASASRR